MRAVTRTALVLAAVAAALVAVSGPGAGEPPQCLVSNDRTDIGSRSLQAAVDVADAGDVLIVKGLCSGPATVTKDLTLKGVSNKPFGTATLDGGGAGTVLTVGQIGSPVDVQVTGLTITGGAGMGGGVYNRNISGTLTLSETVVTGNISTSNGGGGGIFNAGALVVRDSVVSNNVSTTGTASGYGGGGIRNQVGTVDLVGSTVTGNTADAGGGGIYNVSGGVTTLIDSTVADNVAGTRGGGIDGAAGTVVLTRSAVTGNEAANGGGIASGGVLFPASVTLVDSTVAGNSAVGFPGAGGGLLNDLNGTVEISGSSVVANTALGSGGGIRNVGRALGVSDSVIDGNSAARGGGLFNDSFFLGQLFEGRVSLTDVTISGNTASILGGGILNLAMLTMTGVVFSGNLPEDCFGVCA
jgi:hypothetical protein